MIEYARALGFAPHPDFPEALFGPRPAVLLATPMARPERPIYIPGPDDDVAQVLARLSAAVGPDGFDMPAPAGLFSDIGDVEEIEDETDGDDAQGTPPPITG